MSDARVKVCGVTRVKDADLALELGVWAVGLIFFEDSPRRCAIDQAVAIGRRARRRAEVCGVFVNAHLDEVVSTADSVGLTMLQFQGEEGPVFCGEAARRTGCRVIKASSLRTRADLQALHAFATDYHLLDGSAPGLHGGTGRTFDWKLVAEHRGPTPVIVSGGLTPANVGDAIRATSPFAVDTASGTESVPGVKDPALLAAFCAAAASAGATTAAEHETVA